MDTAKRAEDLERLIAELIGLGITIPEANPGTSSNSSPAPSAPPIPVSQSILCSLAQNKFPKDIKLPTFSGTKTESVEDWLFVVDSVIETNAIRDEQVVKTITPHLRGAALHLLQRYQLENSHEKDNWDNFKDALRERFVEKDR